ncbi:MAG: hypothetical protein ABSG63_22060 [Spirochaetia bacterium]
MLARRAGTNIMETSREKQTPIEAKRPKSRMAVRYDPMMKEEKPRTMVRAARNTRTPTSRKAACAGSPCRP